MLATINFYEHGSLDQRQIRTVARLANRELASISLMVSFQAE